MCYHGHRDWSLSGSAHVRPVGVCACASSRGLRMCVQSGSAHVRPVGVCACASTAQVERTCGCAGSADPL